MISPRQKNTWTNIRTKVGTNIHKCWGGFLVKSSIKIGIDEGIYWLYNVLLACMSLSLFDVKLANGYCERPCIAKAEIIMIGMVSCFDIINMITQNNLVAEHLQETSTSSTSQ